MKALKITGIFLLVIVVIVVIFTLVQPPQGHVERSIVIEAPPSTVFAQVNSFRNFNSWSPWAKMDPDAQYTYEGPEAGVGAKMNWEGKSMGKGSQWIVESVPDQRVKNGLTFEDFDGTFYSEYRLQPEGSGTKLTWTYEGINDGFSRKFMWLFMKGALGTQYEEGLADLKHVIEKKPASKAHSEAD
jgi:hypothetical protein